MSDGGMQWWQTDGQFRAEWDKWNTLLNRGDDMPNINAMTGSKYLKGADVAAPRVVTIKSLSEENLARDDQPRKMKWIMMFTELEKGLVLNKTNLKRCAKALLSDETEEWIGKRIKLYFDPDVEMGGEIVGGIRISRAGTAPAKQDDDPDSIPF